MANDRITLLESLYALTYFLHPTGIFMSHDVWKLYVDLLAPDSFNHMKVSAAYACSANSHDDVRVIHELGLRHFLQFDVFRASKGGVVIV
jgi:hypothetical protein